MEDLLYIAEFNDYWQEQSAFFVDTECPFPEFYERTLKRWRQQGLTSDDLKASIDVAMARGEVPPEDKFRYMCGVANRIISQKKAAREANLFSPPIYTQDEFDKAVHDAWMDGADSERWMAAYGERKWTR